MNLNYHEMTMQEPRDSPARRKQFLVICTLGLAMLGNSMINAGILQPADIKEGIFPGGNFVYKTTARDYATSPAMLRVVAKDLKLGLKKHGDDLFYTVYLDDPNTQTHTRRTRFAGGILVDDVQGKEYVPALLEKNKDVKEWDEKVTDVNLLYKSYLKYHQTDLQSVDAGVLHFPYTDGFISALIFTYKLYPQLIAYGRANIQDKNESPVVISTCSIKDSMCTHYVPLVQAKSFRLGQDAYTQEELKPDSLSTIAEVSYTNVMKGFKRALGFSSKKKKNDATTTTTATE